jgi:small subunit ribosomal protein S16
MLSIRLQRVGRKGHAVYRVIVQDSHRQPTSGKIVAQLGTYDPHTKTVNIDKEKASTYLKNGAQPTPRVVTLLVGEKIELPKWVAVPGKDKQKSIKNAEKLRRNQPKEEAPAEEAEAAIEATPEQEAVEDVKADESVEEIAEAEVAEAQQEATEEVAQSAEESEDEKPATA